MGLILDSSVLIASERRGEMLADTVLRMQSRFGEKLEAGLSAVSVVELTHGIYRAETNAQRELQRAFVDDICRGMVVHPVTLDVVRLAGGIKGEQASNGVTIAFENLVIGATALHLGFGVATLNVRHFQHIPGLNVVTP